MAEQMEPKTVLMAEGASSSKRFPKPSSMSPEQQEGEIMPRAYRQYREVRSSSPLEGFSGAEYSGDGSGYSTDDVCDEMESTNEKWTEDKLKKKKVTMEEESTGELLAAQDDGLIYIQWLKDNARRYMTKIAEEEEKMAKNRTDSDGCRSDQDLQGCYFEWLQETAQRYKKMAIREEKKWAKRRKANVALLTERGTGESCITTQGDDKQLDTMMHAFATSLATGISAQDSLAKSEDSRKRKRNSSEPQTSPSENDRRNYMLPPKIIRCDAEQGMDSMQEDTIPCPQGCPSPTKKSNIRFSSDSCQNSSQSGAYSREPVPCSSHQKEIGMPSRKRKISVTEKDTCEGQQPWMGDSTLRSDSPRAEGLHGTPQRTSSTQLPQKDINDGRLEPATVSSNTSSTQEKSSDSMCRIKRIKMAK